METEEKSPQNLIKDFAHARRLLKTTSRGKNPDWYREGYLLSEQVHLIASGNRYRTFYWNTVETAWEELEPIPVTNDPAVLEEYINYLRSEKLPSRCQSLGIVMHLSKDASVFEYAHQNWEETYEGSSLQELIRKDPASVLQDRTLTDEVLSFRVYPIPASPETGELGCAVATSWKGNDMLRELRELGSKLNFPIQTSGLSSPLLLLSRLPRTLGPTERPFCVMLRYEDFSFFGYFSAEGELVLLRSTKHQNQQLPHSLESTLNTTASSVEISSFDLKVFDCRSSQSTPLEDDLRAVLFTLPFQVYLSPEVNGAQLPIELTTFQIEDDNPRLEFSSTETFGQNIADKHHLQDFFAPSDAELEKVPGAIDMKLLRFARLASQLGLVACLLLGGLVAFNSLAKKRTKDWTEGEKANPQVVHLTNELKQVRSMEQLLADRSKGWAAMELYARLFPADNSVKFTEATHSASVEKTSKIAAKAGFVKSWVIKGLAQQEATKRLDRLNTMEGMSEVFEAVKEATGSSSYDLNKNSRNLVVNMDITENSGFIPNSPALSRGSYPYMFTLKITQRIEAGDPLALTITKL